MNSTQRKNKKVKRREGKGREIFYRKIHFFIKYKMKKIKLFVVNTLF